MMIYLSGKIEGNPDYEKQFHEAELYLMTLPVTDENGTIFFNPADLPKGKTPAEYMRICFAALEMADVVAMLPNWSDSAGARIEHDYAKYIGKRVIYM